MNTVRNKHPRKQPVRVSGFAVVPFGETISVPDDVAKKLVKEGRFEVVKESSAPKSTKPKESK